MLDSLGYQEVAERSAADLILFNTCSIRESADNRFVAHLGEAKRLKSEDPERVVGVGGCWAQSVKDEVFERFPFVDVAFGPGQIHRLAEFLTQDSLTAQGYFEFEDFSGHLPAKRAREFQGWVQISVGCNCACAYCIVPQTRGREVSRRPGELIAEIEALAARGGSRGDPAGPEREQLRARPAEGASGSRSPSCLGWVDASRGRRADPLHESPPQGHARGRDSRPRRAAGALRAHPPAPAVGLEPHPEGDAPNLQPGALPGPSRPDSRARAGLRPDHGHHRRLPGRDRRRLRRDPRGGRPGRLRRRLHVHLLAAPGHAGGDDDRPGPASGQAGADVAPGRAGPAPRPRARPALRGAEHGGAGRRAEQDRPGKAPWPHRPQQDGQLRGHRPSPASWSRWRSPGPRRPRSRGTRDCSAESPEGSRDLRPDRGREDGGGNRDGRPATGARRGPGGGLVRRAPGLSRARDAERGRDARGTVSARAPAGRLRRRDGGVQRGALRHPGARRDRPAPGRGTPPDRRRRGRPLPACGARRPGSETPGAGRGARRGGGRDRRERPRGRPR